MDALIEWVVWGMQIGGAVAGIFVGFVLVLVVGYIVIMFILEVTP